MSEFDEPEVAEIREVAKVRKGVRKGNGGSRKTRAAWTGAVLIGVVASLADYLNIDAETVQVVIYSIVGLFGVNIAGIAHEDAAEKKNGGAK